MLLNKQKIWPELEQQKLRLENVRLDELFSKEANRIEQFTADACGLHLDYSRNFIDHNSWIQLLTLCDTTDLRNKINQVIAGETWNNTEKRAVLHSALRRNDKPVEVKNTLAKMRDFVKKIHSHQWLGFKNTPITDIVNIGIGGSDLGPVMACRALTPYSNPQINIHFVSNVDAFDISNNLKNLKPESTLFIIASKSFTTLETLTNAKTARQWFLESGSANDVSKHFVAVSSCIEKAEAFGIHKDNVFPMWDWVGGRFSLWSAIGLPIALATSMDTFEKLLAGAAQMDEHFIKSDWDKNLPVILALLEIWYVNFWGAESQAVLPYDESLAEFPNYLQQMIMESNGKLVSRNGEKLDYKTSPIIWGAAGTNGQHSFHQLLHQGSHLIPCDFIIPLKSHIPLKEHHQHLVANAFAQIAALTYGRSFDESLDEVRNLANDEASLIAKHKVIPGNRPSTVILLEKLTPETLGSLIALYENKVLVSSIFWDVNAFDQWGVELGKTISKKIHPALLDKNSATFDTATQHLIDKFHEFN